MRNLKILLAIKLRGALHAPGRRGKKASLGRKILMGFLFLYVIGVMMALFGATTAGLVSSLAPLGLSWMALAVGAFSSAALCFILTVFSMQSQIFQAKDGDLLLSLPVTPLQIAASRLLSLLVLEYAYNALVMIPTVGVYCYLVRPGLSFYPMLLVLLLALPLLPLSLAGAVGYLLAQIGRLLGRGKNIIMLVLTTAAFLAYLYFCMNLNSYITLLIQRGEELSHVFRKAMPPFYHFAIALEQGSLSSFLWAVLWGVLPAGVFLWLVQKGFLDLRSTSGVKAVYRKKPLRVSRPWMAVCRKEGARLLSMPTYLFNCGIGALLMVAMAAMVAWKGTDALQALGAVPQIQELIAPALMAAMCFCAATTCTTSPSISLEGDRLWVLRSSPLSPQDVFLGKLAVNMILLLPAVAISVIILAFSAGLSPLDLVLLFLLPSLLGLLIALFGLYANLLWPRLDYTSENAVVKQSASVMAASFGGMGAILALGLCYWFLARKVMSYHIYCFCALALLALGCILLWRLLLTKGAKEYEQL